MTDWLGASAAGRLQPEDDATREARHEVLTTLLAAYVDGELPPETIAQIDAHLLGCSRCRREVTVHQSLVTRLSRVTRPAASAALEARLRAVIATAPVVSTPGVSTPGVSAPGDAPPHAATDATDAGTGTGTGARRMSVASRRRWIIGAASLAVALAVALVVRPRERPPAGAVLEPAPLVVRAPIPLLNLVAADFRAASARDLPGRARDLETVRGAVPFPVEPLRRPDLQLVAAWTIDLEGEVAAVLAYKWRDTLVLQYVVSDAWLFRSLPIRGAFADGRAVATDASGVGMLAWSSGRGSSIVVAGQHWPTLARLHPQAH